MGNSPFILDLWMVSVTSDLQPTGKISLFTEKRCPLSSIKICPHCSIARRVDIGGTMEKKIAALGKHQSQVVQWPRWEEWMRRRAQDAGASQGLKCAKAFKRLILR